MKIVAWILMALAVANVIAPVVSAVQDQTPPAQVDPQWITVWRIPLDENRDGKPFVDIRVVVQAKNEATAIIRSYHYFRAIFPDWVLSKIEHIESAPRRPDGEKK